MKSRYPADICFLSCRSELKLTVKSYTDILNRNTGVNRSRTEMKKQYMSENIKGRDGAISMIRAIALLMIIACHFCQYYELEIAWWLNAGVQVFLCISGYLYGRRKTGDVLSFYGRRFRKILVPYYVTIAVFALCMFIFRSGMAVSDLGRMVIMSGTVTGGGHLWFVPTILFCYVLTPLLEKIYTLDCIKGKVSFIWVTLLSMAAAAIFCMGFAEGYDQTCLVCYIIGYAIGANSERGIFRESSLTCFFGLLALMNCLQIYFDYVKHAEFSGALSTLYGLWSRYNHVWLGVFLFLLLKRIFSDVPSDSRMLGMLDSVSYETYLVHQFFILGPFSIPAVIDEPAAAVPAALLCIAAAAALLKFLSGRLASSGGKKEKG